jgi:hypothetical protein
MKVQNKDSGQVEDFSDSELPGLATSGKYNIPEKEYDFVDNSGEKYSVPAAGVKEALDLGWKYQDEGIKKDAELEKKYGDQTVKALLYGGARGLTLGLSDVALTKSGLVSPEELSEVKARNEGASITGDVLGTALPLFLSGGSSVAARATAEGGEIAAKSLARKILEKSPSVLVSEAAETVGKKAAQNITSQVAKGAAELGAAGAVEGAILGVGETISEASLGDAEFNAQALLSNVGTGALVGGGMGGLLGAGIEYTKKATKGLGSKIRKRVASQVEDTSLAAKVADEDAMEEGLMALKDPEIQRIKQEYPDAPVSKGMESAYKPVKQAENYLYDAPSAAGEEIRRKSQDITDWTENTVNDVWSGAKTTTPEEAGNLARQSLMQNINEPWQSGKSFYDDFMNDLGGLPVGDSYRTGLANEIKKSDAYRIGSEGADIKRVLNILEDKQALISQHQDELLSLGLNKRQVNELIKEGGVTAKLNKELNEAGINLNLFNSALSKHAKELPTKELTLRQIKELQSDIGAAMRVAKGSERKLLRNSYERLGTMMDSIITDATKGTKQADKIKGALKAANNDYVRAYQAKDEVADLLGVKGKDFDEVMDKLENMSAVDIAKKFLDLKKSDKALEILKKYPDIGKVVLATKQNELISKHITQKGVSYAGIRKDLIKMPKEQRELYFLSDKASEKRFMDALYLFEKRPQTLNPSGTDIRNEVRNLLSPKEIFKNWAFSTIYRGSDSELGKYVTKVVPTLAAVEQSANKTKGKISSSVGRFFKNARPAVSKGTVEGISEKKLEKARKSYEEIQANPMALLDKFADKNKDLMDSAPETYAALQGSLIAGVQFLQSKTPQVDQDYMTLNRSPSRSELIKFSDYVEAVETPSVIYDQISEGYVNANTVEALKVVYPRILEGLKAEVLAKKPKYVSRQQATELHKLMGIKTIPAMDYDKMMILQGQTQGAQQAEAQIQEELSPKMSAPGAREMSRDQMTATGFQRTINRA